MVDTAGSQEHGPLARVTSRVSPPNEPTRAEIEFVARFVDRKVREAERQVEVSLKLDHAISTEIDRIQAAFADLASDDGGNYPLRRRVDRKIGLDRRLAAIGVSQLPARLAPSSRPQHRSHFSYKIVGLEEYLLELEDLWPAAEPLSTTNPQLQQLADYLGKLVAGSCRAEKPVGFLFLLRDTLLLYLGARYLRTLGASIDPRAALISRDLLHSFTKPSPRNPLYAGLYNTLFASAPSSNEPMSDSFAAAFSENWRAQNLRGQASLDAFLKDYLNRVLEGGGRFAVVDSGTFGTMPLLAMISDRRIADMQLFTAAPWMQNFYGSRVHSTASDRLYALEDLTCHQELFSFAEVKDGRIYVQVSQDPAVVYQALGEMRSFLQIVEAHTAKSLL